MSKYTIVDIDLNINAEEIMSNGAQRISEKTSRMLQEAIQDAKSIDEAAATKAKEVKDLSNEFLYDYFKSNNNRLTRDQLAALIPDKFKTFSTMIMRFGNFLRKHKEFEYIRKTESKSTGIVYMLEAMDNTDDSVINQADS